MLITQEEIELAVQQFVQAAIRYEDAEEFSIRDHGDTFDQVKDTITAQLLFDPNVVFYLLSLGARRQAENIQSLLTALEGIEDRFESLRLNPQPDNVTDSDMSSVESMLRNQYYLNTEHLEQTIDTLSKKIGVGLISSGQMVEPISTARQNIFNLLDDIDDLFVVLIDDLNELVNGYDAFSASTILGELEARVVQSAKSLLFDMRLERVDTDPAASQEQARSRVVQLQAAKIVLQRMMMAANHSDSRVLSGSIPEGTDLRLYPYSPSAQIPRQESVSGGFNVSSRETIIISANDDAPATVQLERTSEVNLIATNAPTPATSGDALFFVIGDGLTEYDAEIVEPATYLGGAPALGNQAHGYLEVNVSDAIVGHSIQLSYVGDRSLLTADQEKAVDANTGTYRVIGYDGKASLATPIIKIDPPLPSGYSPNVPLTEWHIESIGLTPVWHPPTSVGAYPSYLDRIIAEISGPTVPGSFDAFQQWRIHTRLTGTAVGTFLPGERVLNTNGTIGEKQGVVVFHNGNEVYILEAANAFTPGDDIEGYESGATLTGISAVDLQVADEPNNSGQVNQARFVTALSGSVLHLQSRTSFGGGSDATIDDGSGGIGDLLTIGAGDRGLWEMGLFNGSTVTVDGTDYTIDTITDNKSATLTTSALVVSQSWEVPVPETIQRILLSEFGTRYKATLKDVSNLIAAGLAAGYTPGDPFELRTSYTDGANFSPARTLQFDLPVSDSVGRMSAQEIIDELRAAQIPGLAVSEERTTIYRHPDDSAPITLTQGSNQSTVSPILPSDDETSSLIGYYLIPEQGVHRGESFLITNDVPGRTLTYETSARATESLKQYRIEARRVVITLEERSDEEKIVFGAGTAHSALGFPSSQSVYGLYNKWELRQNSSRYDLDELSLVRGDKISSPTISFEENSILDLTDEYLLLESAMSAEQAGSIVQIKGECYEQWSEFEQNFRPVLGAFQNVYPNTEPLRLSLSSILNATLSVQESDLAAASRVLTDMKSKAQSLLTVLQSVSVPDVAAGRAIVEALQEYNYDSTLDQLTGGRYEEFFAEGSEQATRSGRVQSLLAQAQRGLGETDRSVDYEEQADTPLYVNEAVEEPDDQGGYTFDQFFDDEDTGSEQDF